MKVIDGKYRILKQLGEGFGGCVFLSEAGGSQVALKQLILDQGTLSLDEILDNFKAEFTTLSKLAHPHIVQILDFGFDAKEKIYYFTTEYIEGPNIFDGTRNSTPQEIEEFFVQTLRALSYLHSQRIYHLDIKPENILIGVDAKGNRIAKLIDFGLTAFRSPKFLAGSPAYIAPEALIGEPRDGRADLYALGVTWYKCLTGENPFQAEDLEKTLDLQRIWTPPPVSSGGTNIPAYLDPILDKLLRKNPSDRYHRADQVIRDLNWSGVHHYPLETELTALSYLPGAGKLVGREKEWNSLIEQFNRLFVAKTDSKALILVTGPHGTGKSRLLRELKYYAQLHMVPVYPLKEFTPKNLKSDCVILCDDADEEAMEMVRRLLWQFHASSILFLLSGTKLQDPTEIGVALELRNFNRSEVAQYIASVLGIDQAPDFLVDQLRARSEGNPLFLTEILQSLIQSQQIFDDYGRWSAGKLEKIGIDFDKLSISKNISDYCEKKYKELTEGAQRILSLLAITKAPLHRHQLIKLGLGLDKGDWELLQRENLLDVNLLSDELTLLNPSFQDWIPGHLDPALLRQYHQSLGQLFREEPNTQEASSFHLGLGLDSDKGRHDHLMHYGNALMRKNRWLEAARIFDLASSQTPDVEGQVDGYLSKATALFRVGHTSEALKVLEEMRSILKKERENPQKWRWVQKTYRDMGIIHLKEKRPDLAREALEASRVLLEEHEENPVEEIILDNLKGSLLLREGKTSEALEIFETTYRRWESLPLHDKKQVLSNELGHVYHVLGRRKEAREFFERQLTFYDEIGNRDKKAYALYGLAVCCSAAGQFEDAQKCFTSCADLSRQIKNEELLFHALNGLGNLAFSQKDFKNAANYYEQALELAQHAADADSSIGIAINVASIFRTQGDSGRALLYLRQIIETLENQLISSMYRDRFLVHAYIELGQLHLARSKWLEAHDSFRDALRLIQHQSSLKQFRFSTQIGLIQSDLRLNHHDEVQGLLKDLEKEPLLPAEKEELDQVRGLISTCIF